MPDYSRTFKHWQTATSAPTDGSLFLGRLSNTNRAIAVRMDGEDWVDASGKPVQIEQWISFADYGNIRQCVWRGTDV